MTGHVLDAGTGIVLAPWDGSLPAVSGDRTVKLDQGALVAQDLEGRLQWQVGTRGEYGSGGTYSGLPLIVGTTVFAHSAADAVEGLDLRTGEPVWRSTTRPEDGYRASSSGGFAARGDRLVAAFGGKLIGYGPGADTKGLDVDPWTRPSAVRLGLTSSTPRISYGHPAVLGVHYERRIGQDEQKNLFAVEADPFPFDGRWSRVHGVSFYYSSDTNVTVWPKRNTRYRVRYRGTTPERVTAPRKVLVDLGFRVGYRFLSPTRLRAISSLRGPAGVLRARRRVAFYFYHRSTGHGRRLRIVTLRPRAKRARDLTVLHVPAHWARRDVVFGCLIERRDDGFGRFVRYRHPCGARRI